MALDALDFRLVNDWQRGFPLTPQPYAVLAQELGVAEAEVIGRLRRLLHEGAISRIGAVFRPHVLGHSTLAALACPAERLESVAAQVSACPEVNHNYEREHPYNLWFVVTAPSERRVAEVLAELHRDTGLRPLDLPMVADYHIDLGFDLNGRQPGAAPASQSTPRLAVGVRQRGPHRSPAGSPAETAAIRTALTGTDYALAAALETGLPLVSRPYAALGAGCGLDEAAVLAGLARLLLLGAMRRIGVVVRHRELGFSANAMVVWDVPDGRVDEVGRLLAGQDAVTLCYRRPRRLPDWPYNLFSMVHGRDRDTVLAELARMRGELGLDAIPCRPLFSCRRFKQCGARYAGYARAA